MKRPWITAAAVATLALGTTDGLYGQASAVGATVVGRVLDKATGRPIAGATMLAAGPRWTETTDDSGRATFRGLAVGLQVIQVKALGFKSELRNILLDAGDPVELVVEMTPVVLVPVVINGIEIRVGTRFEEFDRRRARGRGHFFTRADIEKRNASSLTDLLQTVRGVKLDCGAITCGVRMARSAQGCFPEYWIDGRLSNEYASTFSLRAVEGIEVYTGPSEMPAEFSGSNAACGAVVMWTKSGP